MKRPATGRDADTLWRKRLAVEARARRPKLIESNGSPVRFSRISVRTTLRLLLKPIGLLARGEKNALSPMLRTIELARENLPEAFDGFRLLHLSDFHFDRDPKLARAIGRLIEHVRADLCVMTGDYTFNEWGPQDHVYRGMELILENINVIHGVIGILGNNDRSAYVDQFRKLGIRMLINENEELAVQGQSIWIVGVDDPHHFRCAGLECATQGIPADAFTLLLAHSPELVRKAAQRNIDLYLCGHTHGGQICLPGIGPVFLNMRGARRYARGPWRYARMQGHTTAGLGTTAAAIRFNCPPEATLITLRKGNPS